MRMAGQVECNWMGESAQYPNHARCVGGTLTLQVRMGSMQGKQQDMDVLSGWRAFVEATGMAKSLVQEADVY